MKLSLTHLITASAFVIAGAFQASAQTAKFDLPFEARWGNVVLAPGSYTLRTPDFPGGAHIFYLQSNAGTKMVVPTIVDSEATSESSHLKLVKVNGTYYVQEYVSPATGMAISFAVPRQSYRKLVAEDGVLIPSGF